VAMRITEGRSRIFLGVDFEIRKSELSELGTSRKRSEVSCDTVITISLVVCRSVILSSESVGLMFLGRTVLYNKIPEYFPISRIPIYYW
jgi:hypothetical protein